MNYIPHFQQNGYHLAMGGEDQDNFSEELDGIEENALEQGRGENQRQ